jgi:microcystin-dependent protein
MHPGEIRMCAFNYAPEGYALCDGRQLSVEKHRRLFELLGTTYGGDGVHSFCVPDLRGRAAMHVGKAPAHSIALGERKDAQTSRPPAIAPSFIIALVESGYGDEPFLGEIRMFAGINAPRDWFTCQNQYLPLQRYMPLFSLLGTTHGGDGKSNFRIPDLKPYLGHTFIIAHQGYYPTKGE